MKKLLVFTSTFPRWKNDTIPPFVYELSKRLTKDFDVYVLAPHYPGAKDFEIMDKMKVYRFRYFLQKYEKLAGEGGILPVLKKNPFYYFEVPFFLFWEYFALKNLVKKIQPDVIHAHWIIPQGFIAALVKTSTNVPYVVTSHGSDIIGLKGYKLIKKFTLENAKNITVVSNSLKDEALKISPNLKIEVIPMGVDTKLFNPHKRDLSIKKKYKIKGPFLLFVGRLAPEKGIKFLLEAMPKVIKEYPEAKLMIIGDGTLKEELKKSVKKLNIEKNIIFMGWVKHEELPKYYATADIFVCPSLREGFGLTFAEAAICGCNLIGPNVGGIQHILSINKDGLLLEKLTGNKIALKIIYLIKKYNPYRTLKNKLIKELSITETIKKYNILLR